MQTGLANWRRRHGCAGELSQDPLESVNSTELHPRQQKMHICKPSMVKISYSHRITSDFHFCSSSSIFIPTPSTSGGVETIWPHSLKQHVILTTVASDCYIASYSLLATLTPLHSRKELFIWYTKCTIWVKDIIVAQQLKSHNHSNEQCTPLAKDGAANLLLFVWLRKLSQKSSSHVFLKLKW